MTLLRNRLLASTMIAGFTLLVPGLASAQTAPDPAKPAASDKKSTEVEEVVVTGSRIKRNEYTSSAPIQVITSEESTLEGLSNTSQILQQSTLAAGSFQVNNELTGFVVTGGPGVNTVSLRGLGANRTLVLLNGRRVPPAGVRGTVGPVDLGVIPSSIIDRIEILKDGASSIYGSDAVAGVVNIITKTNLDGAAIDILGDKSQRGGGDQYHVNGVWGKTFDRGYINVAADYFEQVALRRGDRKELQCLSDYEFTQATHQPIDFIAAPGTRGAGNPVCYNLFASAIQTSNFGNLIYPIAGVNYGGVFDGNSGGSNNATGNFGATPTPFGFARETRSGFPSTYRTATQQSALYDRATAVSPVKRYSLFATGGWDITENTQAYGEALWNRRDSEQDGVRQFFPSIFTVANGLATNEPQVPAAWTTPGANNLGTILPIMPLASDSSQRIDYARVMGGLRGKVGDFGFLKGWDWDIYAQYGKSSGDYTTDAIYNDRTLAVTHGYTDVTYNGVNCDPRYFQNGSTFVGGGSHSSCGNFTATGIPFVSQRVLEGGFNQAEKDFLFFKNVGHTDYTQKQVEATLTGDLIQLPAGPVGVAVGASWRQDHIDDTPGAQEQNGNLWGQTAAGHTVGTDTVKEYFGEVDIPLLKGIPAFQSLDLQMSGRHTSYASYGASNTYKVGLNWQIVPSFRLRATQGTSFRAPALYELFLAHQTSFLGQTSVDPCINYQNSNNPILQQNCFADHGIPTGYAGAGSSATIVTGGGAGILKAETSKAKTIGAIWTPKFIDLSIAVDYSDIVVNNEVTRFGAGNILNACYSSTNYPNDPFCSLFTRDNNQFLANGVTPNPNFHKVLIVNNNYTNVAQQINHALDLTMRYRHDFDFGRLTINGQATWQLKNSTQLSSLFKPTDANGSTQNPDFNAIINTRFDHGDWTAFWSMNAISKNSDSGFSNQGGPALTDIVASQRYSTLCNFRTSTAPLTFVQAQCNDPTFFGHFAIASASGAVSSAGAQPTIPTNIYLKRYAEFTVYHTISIRKKFDTWTVEAGIQNLFDEKAPNMSAGETRIGTASVFNYDLIGRRGFLEITKRW